MAVSSGPKNTSGVSVSLERAKIAILGSGPTGLGVANRLQEFGLSNFVVYEKEDHAGGLAGSFTDANGFTWDVGGHVQFSHYTYFDKLMDELLGDQWLYHQRESWIWMRNTFIPYPFQNNIRHLPEDEMQECLDGLTRLISRGKNGKPANFEQWIYAHFGDGIAKHFLMPYNFKVWAYTPNELASTWVGERVAKIDLDRILANIREERDDISWGPNNTFRYPLHGGTGETWRRLAGRFGPSQLRFNKTVSHLTTCNKTVYFADGTNDTYDILISTIPLDVLVGLSDLKHLAAAVQRLRYSTVHIVGVGLNGAPPPHLKTKCWMYFPENTSPFYRATVLSNYSYMVVPQRDNFWSLMVEVSESPAKPVDREGIVDSVISGMLATRLLDSPERIVDTWHYMAEHGYPTPTLERDSILQTVLPALEQHQIFSRGRFGAWKYEVSNQDHSLMQGVELVNRLAGLGEEETLNRPDYVNSRPKATADAAK